MSLVTSCIVWCVVPLLHSTQCRCLIFVTSFHCKFYFFSRYAMLTVIIFSLSQVTVNMQGSISAGFVTSILPWCAQKYMFSCNNFMIFGHWRAQTSRGPVLWIGFDKIQGKKIFTLATKSQPLNDWVHVHYGLATLHKKCPGTQSNGSILVSSHILQNLYQIEEKVPQILYSRWIPSIFSPKNPVSWKPNVMKTKNPESLLLNSKPVI